MNIRMLFDFERDKEIFNLLLSLNKRKRAFCMSALATNGHRFSQRLSYSIVELDKYISHPLNLEETKQIQVNVNISDTRLLQHLKKPRPQYRAELLRRSISLGLFINDAPFEHHQAPSEIAPEQAGNLDSAPQRSREPGTLDLETITKSDFF